MGNRAAYYGDCKSPYSAPADCKSAGTGSVLGAATVFAGPVVATGAFVLGVVNAYGGFDEGYDYLNNMKTNNR